LVILAIVCSNAILLLVGLGIGGLSVQDPWRDWLRSEPPDGTGTLQMALGKATEVSPCKRAQILQIDIMDSVTKTALDSIPNGAQFSSPSGQKRVLLLKPRGFCAGVVRAIDIVKIALETFGAPIYVRREIVHNRYVVNELAEKGAIFVHEIDDVPDGQRVIYSAHGVSPAVRDRSKGRGLKVIDATCPLVTKVHIEAVKFAKQGYSLVLIGHRDHDEIEGTLGEAPDVTQVVSNAAEVATLEVPDPDRVAYLTQTTLSLDEARDIIHALKQKFPNIVGPHSQDICYATENRQVAVRNVAHNADLVLVVGSTNSSNSNRLVEVSRNLGTIGYLIDNSQAIDSKWLQGVSTVAVTAGASAPEVLVEDVVNYLRQNGFSSVEEVEVMPENVRFGLPPEIVQAIGSSGGAQSVPVR
jgi:4-hydroxy-3-methylbut-2-en-1-yl diphosphate reductase